MIKDKLILIKLFLLDLLLFKFIYGSPVNKKISLTGDDIIYDKIYVDNNSNIPCIRIDNIDDDKSEDQIGLYFNYEIYPMKNTKYVNSLSKNTLKFNQKEGLLLLNDVNIIGEAFDSQNLELRCINQYENLYVVIKDEKDGTIYWRYPELEKKKSISSSKKEKLFVGESLYDEHLVKHFNLTENGFKIHDEYLYSVTKENAADLLEYIYLEKEKDHFKVQFVNSNNNSNNKNSIQVENISNAETAELRYEENYGYYIIDSNGNILKKSKGIVYDDNNRFTIGKKLHVGDSIVSKNGHVCVKLDENFELQIGEKIFRNMTNIEIKNNMESPVTVGNTGIFEYFNKRMKNIGKLPSSMSLRCHQQGNYTFLAIYNDDTDEIIDEVIDRCRRDDELLSNTDYDRNLCLNNSLIGSNGMKCLSYQKSSNSNGFELTDFKNKPIYTLMNQDPPSSFYLEDDTGNFITSLGSDYNIVLLEANSPKVQMTCNAKNEIVMNTRDEKKTLIWKYRPNSSECKNGLESTPDKNQPIDCSIIYKLETIGNFKISQNTLKNYYNDNILSLKIENNGVVKYNEKHELFKDEWNLNRKYNYSIKCAREDPSECIFMNLNTQEVIKELQNDQISTTFYANNNNNEKNKFEIGQKIMCKNGKYGLILNNKGFTYRFTENNEKMEEFFYGEDLYFEIGNVIDAYFDKNYNFVINYDDGDSYVLASYVNNFNNNSSNSKDIRIGCNDDNGKIEFYEVCNNKKMVYFEYPKPKFITTVTTKYSTSYSTSYSTIYSTKTQTSLVTTTTPSYETYAYVTYLGTTGSKYILGVNKLGEYSTLKAEYGGILNKNESKYTRWLVKSISDYPSKMILANQNGDLSDYCLNVGQATGDSYYLSITKCSKAKYLFKYYNVKYKDRNGVTWTKSPIIAVYKNSSTLLTNNKGIPYCIYYSDTLYLKECKSTKDYPKYKWATVVNRGTHVHTSSITKTKTSTRYVTTSSVKSSIITSVKTSVITTVIPATTTTKASRNTKRWIRPTNSIE